MAKKNEYISTAYERLKNISADDRKRFEYEAREKAIRDHNHLMFTARRQGLEEGMKASIQICKNLGISVDETKELLTLNFHISSGAAKKVVVKYWTETKEDETINACLK